MRIEDNYIRVTEIEKVTSEGSQVKQIFFYDKQCSQGKPGQFIMIWLPGVDEIPMSISSTHPSGLVSVVVRDVGEATKLLHKKHEGDSIGIRGPFGNSFQLEVGNSLLIGGGTGIAPLTFLAQKLNQAKSRLTFLIGAKSKDELLFYSRIERLNSITKPDVFASTEDGSFGYKGMVTDLIQEVMEKDHFNIIYACGRELMLYKIFKLAQKFKTPLQVSLERFMRCAIGLCGSCTIGKYRVCVDGPVFTDTQLKEVEAEFGHVKRDLNGHRIPL